MNNYIKYFFIVKHISVNCPNIKNGVEVYNFTVTFSIQLVYSRRRTIIQHKTSSINYIRASALKTGKKKGKIYATSLVGLCDLVSSLVLTLHTSKRKGNLLSSYRVSHETWHLVNSLKCLLPSFFKLFDTKENNKKYYMAVILL